MNERIKELAERANVTPLYSPAYAPRYIFEEEELEKFAELIVRECIEIVEPCKCGCCDGEPEGIITDIIIKQIKEHFGG
jgi:hypothetical protein